MATTFPNTSDFNPKVYTDFSIKADNDLTLSTIGANGTFTSSSTNTINVKIFKAFNYNTGSFQVFKDVPNGYVQEISDLGSNFINLYSGSNVIDYAFVAPHNGLFTFSLRQKGHAIGTPEEKKGSFLRYKLRKYLSSSVNNHSFSGARNVYETSLHPLIYTSSRYNYTLETKGNSIKSIDYSDTGDFQLSTIGTPLPFNTLTQNNSNTYESLLYTIDGSSHEIAKVPRSGSYRFNIKIEGSANITTDIITPSGFQGTFTTPNKTITATLIIKKRDTSGNFTNQYTETKDITVGGVSITDPNPGDTSFTDTRQFNLDSIFDTTGINIELNENESALAFIKLTTPNNLGSQAFSENINGIPGFGLTLTNNFFRLKDTSFLKLNSYTPLSGEDQFINFLIQEDNIEIPLRQGEAISLIGETTKITSSSINNFIVPNNAIDGTTIVSNNITDIRLSTDNFFKVTQALTNNYNSNQHISSVKQDGHSHYQPIYGSFYVDLSDVNATPSTPVRVQIPLHGINKYSDLPFLNQVSGSLTTPNSRRFLNHSVEVNLTTTQNHTGSGIFNTPDYWQNTNATHECNFIHWGDDPSHILYNSALVTRFDRIGTGFTSEDINSTFSPPDGDIVNTEDLLNINFNNNSLFGIYEGGADIDTSDIPSGSLFSPRIVLLNEQNFSTVGMPVIVQPAPALFDPDGDLSLGGTALTGSLTPGRLHIKRIAEGNWGWVITPTETGDFANNGASVLWWNDRPAAQPSMASPGFKRYQFFHNDNKETKLVFDAPPGFPDTIENVSRPIRLTAPLNSGVATYVSAETDAEIWLDLLNVYGSLFDSSNTNDVDYSSLDPDIVEDMGNSVTYNPFFIDLDHSDYDGYPPTIAPYLDRIRVQGYDNGDPTTGTPLWVTASNSPVNFNGNDINAGNKTGPDTAHNVQNYYTIPETGFYNVTYLFDLIVSSLGGDLAYNASPTYYPSSRQNTIMTEVMFSRHPIKYDAATHGADRIAHYETISGHAANTLYGVIKRTPDPDYTGNAIIPGDTAGVPRIVVTSSLSLVTKLDKVRTIDTFNNTGFTRFNGYIDDFGREQWNTFHLGVGQGSGLQEQAAIVDNWANWNRDIWDLNSNTLLSLQAVVDLAPDWVYFDELGQTILIQINPLYGPLPTFGEGPFGTLPTVTANTSYTTDFLLPILNTPVVEDNTGFTSFVGALDQMLTEVSNIQDLQEQAAASQLVDAGPIARYIRQYWDIGDDFEGVSNFLHDQFFNSNNSNDSSQVGSSLDFNAWIGAASQLDLNETPNGEYYFTPPENWTGADFEAWLVGATHNIKESNVTINFGTNGSTDEDGIPGVQWRGEFFNDLRSSILVNTFNSIYDSLTSGYIPEAMGAASVSDNKNVFFVKGDRVHVEIGLGPIQHENGDLPWYQTNTPAPNTPITGSYKRISSVGGCYVMESSMLGITPISFYNSELTPHLEFIVTNDTNTIVKGTYKHY